MTNDIMSSVSASHIIAKASRVVSIWSPWWINYINKIEFIYYDTNPSGITGLSSMIFIVGKDFLAKNSIMDVAIRLEFALQQSIRSMDTRYDFMKSKYPLIDDSLIGLAQSLEINSDMDDKFSVFSQSEWDLLVSRKVDKTYIDSLDIRKPPRLKKGSWTSYDFDFPPLLRAEKYLDLLVELENNREQEWLDNQENNLQEEQESLDNQENNSQEEQDGSFNKENKNSTQQESQDNESDQSNQQQENNLEQSTNDQNSSSEKSLEEQTIDKQESFNDNNDYKAEVDNLDLDTQGLNQELESFNNKDKQQSSDNNSNIDDFNDKDHYVKNTDDNLDDDNNTGNEFSENDSEDSLNKENNGANFDSNGSEDNDDKNIPENNFNPLESKLDSENDDILDDIEEVNIDNNNSHNSPAFQSLSSELKQQSNDPGRQELQVPQKPDEEEAIGKTREEKEEIQKQLAQDIEDLGDLKLPSGKSAVTKDFDKWKKKKLHKPKSSWKKIFPRMINPIIGRAQLGGQSDMSFSKRNPNQVEGAPLLMGFISYPPEVTVLIDASPSMLKYKDTTMSEFVGVMKGIFMTYAQPITIAAADSGIKFAMNSMTPYGYVLNKVSRTYHGNSVDFGDTIEQILKKGVRYKKGTYPKPDILVIFTDGLFKWPFPNKSKIPAKYAEVLIVSTKPYDELKQILPPWVKNRKNFIAAE